MADRISVGIVGAGKVAGWHAEALARDPAVRLAGVCDPVPERARQLAERYGVPVSTEERMLNDGGVQAVVLATPSDLHLAQVRRFARAGKHALCEFPLFGRPAALAALFERAGARGVLLRVAHTTHYLPPYVEARRLLAEGVLGDIRGVLYRRRLYRPGGIAPDRDWRDNALTHLGGHALDLVLWLLARQPEAVRCAALPSPEEACTTGLLMRMAGGCVAFIGIDFESRPNGILLEIAGSRAVLTATGFSKVALDGQAVWESDDDDATLRAAIAAQDRAFVEDIRNGEDGGQSAHSLRLNQWMARAMRAAL
jgi:predicted dehydrogenase